MTNHDQSFVPSPELDPQLESAVWSVLSEPIDMSAVERVKSRARDMQAELYEPASRAASPTLRRRGLLTLMSLAAAIAIVVGATLFSPSTSNAFAEAIKQLKSTGAFRFTKLIYTTQQEKPIEVQVMVATDGRERDASSGTVSIMNSDRQLRITLIEATKTAIVTPRREKLNVPVPGQLAWLDQLKSHGSQPDQKLGTKTLDGRSVQGFVAKQGQNEFTIWVDANTNDLVQIEHGGMIKGSPITKVVMKDFRFNETFDESLFSFDVPSGYKVMDTLPAVSLPPGEESIVVALRGYTKIADGKFPKSLADWGEWAVLFAKKGVSREESATVMSSLGTASGFLLSLPKDDYQYLGAGKTTTDPRTIVFWHRNKEHQVRAIYNDLTTAVIKEVELPQDK